MSEIPPMPTFVRETLAESVLTKNEFEELYVETDLELPYFDETLNAYVFVYPYELATKYVLLRENCKVIVFCQDDGSGCSVREIYFDYIPSRNTERYWRIVNNYYHHDGYRGSMWSSMTIGQTTYQLELGEDSLILDAQMMDLIDLALDDKVTWMQIEYGGYMKNDTINLSEFLSHFGYSFVGTERDVPRGGMTDDFIVGDWRVYRNEIGDAIYLMVKEGLLIWGQ